MVVERFVPPLVGSGGMTEVVLFTGSLNGNGLNIANRNWLGATDIVVYKAARPGKVALGSVQILPTGTFPANSTVTAKATKNGQVIYTFDTLTGDGSGDQRNVEHQFGQAELEFEAGDEIAVVFDVANVSGAYWSSYSLTLVYH